MNLEAVAAALPTEWVPEDEVVRAICRVSKIPATDRSLARGILRASLGVYGLAECRVTDDRKYEWRRVASPQFQPTKGERPPVMFHPMDGSAPVPYIPQ